MPRRAARRLGRALGRRGTILGCFGTVWALYGYALVTTPPDTSAFRVLLLLWPLHVWGWLWIAAGCVAMITAWFPARLDAAGFGALVLIVVPWMLSNLLSWWPLRDNPRGWIGALIWGAITVPVLVVAGWPEPARPKGLPDGS